MNLTREEAMAATCFACDNEALSTDDDDAGTARCSGLGMIAMEEVTLSASPTSLRQLTVDGAAGFLPSRNRRGLVPLGWRMRCLDLAAAAATAPDVTATLVSCVTIHDSSSEFGSFASSSSLLGNSVITSAVHQRN